MKTARILFLTLSFVPFLTAFSMAREPGWYGRPILSPAERPRNNATHILNRPYRPFHFYGNTVRRRYYRGFALPLPRDFVNGTGSLVRNR